MLNIIAKLIFTGGKLDILKLASAAKSVYGAVKYLRDRAKKKPKSSSSELTDEPEWMKIAKLELGVEEIPGSVDNPRVVKYHAAAGGQMPDEIPWCSSFVNWVMKKAGYDHTKSKAAKSWAGYGTELKEPRYGCIMVFKRTGGHHVGFYVGPGSYGPKILGGNQKDKVSIEESTLQLMAMRWPTSKS